MTDQQEREQTVEAALSTWRKAEREAIRATAQREAADEAVDAARLAQQAAAATAEASKAAQVAAAEAARAADATAQAAHKVLTSTESEIEAKRTIEHEALAAEATAKEAYGLAFQRAERKTKPPAAGEP